MCGTTMLMNSASTEDDPQGLCEWPAFTVPSDVYTTVVRSVY